MQGIADDVLPDADAQRRRADDDFRDVFRVQEQVEVLLGHVVFRRLGMGFVGLACPLSFPRIPVDFYGSCLRLSVSFYVS